MSALLEREGELAAVEATVGQAARGAGSLIVIDGRAGVGKTSVMDVAREAAADAGLTTLVARGAELERSFAFGVVRQLFDQVVREPGLDRGLLFAGAPRRAASLLAVDLEGAPPAPSEDPFAARHALYWLTANLAAERSLAILVDDAHWADEESLGALAHIGNRLEGLPIALVVAGRSEESQPALDALRRQANDSGTHLRVAPLTQDAATAVVRSFAPDADEDLCRACFRASGGNPFLLHELARTVLADGPGGLPADRVLDHSPARVTRAVKGRLSRLPPAAAKIARAAAVLGPDVPLRQAAALAEVEPDEAAAGADALVADGVLRSAKPLEFLHPLLRTAVYDGLGEATRADDHARAARLLADEAAPPERVAAQLLRCTPSGDAWTSEQLLTAARLASARGASEAAARYLRRALEEPPPPDQRTPILFEAALAAATSNAPRAAVDHLREALQADLPLEQRAQATLLLAGLLGHTYRVSEAVDALEEQIGGFDERPDLRREIEVALTNVGRIEPDTHARVRPVVERLRERVESGEEDHPGVLGTIATEMTMGVEPAERTAELAKRALAGFDAVGAGVVDWSSYNAARTLLISESYDSALAVLNQAVERVREPGGVLDAGGGFVFRAELYLRIGNIRGAEVDARTLLEISESYGWPMGLAFGVAWLGEVLIEQDELDEAARVLEGGAGGLSGEDLTHGFTATEVLFARGRLRKAQGRAEEAIEDLRAAGRAALSIGNVNPAVCSWRAELAHALLDMGQTAEAARLAAEDLEMARTVGGPRVTAIALRTMGRVEGGDEEIRMLREAIAGLEDSPARLETARAYAALGAALRRRNWANEAREPLRTAVDVAHRCDARALENHALEELRAAGARPRRRVSAGADALTASERRIADLAADGQANREIAQSLFVTTHTVEFHLRNAYRKLGIRSRAELGDALVAREPARA